MDYVHTEAHQMAYDLSVYLHRKVRDMPHYEKFTLQKDIRESIDGIMDEIEAYEKSKTISHLYAADRLKGKLVRKIRMSHDLKYSAMNDRVYEYCATQIGILGAYIGGLINNYLGVAVNSHCRSVACTRSLAVATGTTGFTMARGL